MGAARRLYVFTDALRDELRAAYEGPRPARIAKMARLLARTGWPRHAFRSEAYRLGLVRESRKPWSADEVAVLEMGLGETSISKLARRLGRTQAAVAAKAAQLQLSIKVRSGYTVQDVCACFGTHDRQVNKWIEKGLLKRTPEGKVDDRSVERFVRRYPHEYDLRRVDQSWFKSVLFSGRNAA